VVNSEKGEEIVEVLGYSKESSPSSVYFIRKANQEDIAKLEENEKKRKNCMNCAKIKSSNTTSV
jgi:hypothetical protein